MKLEQLQRVTWPALIHTEDLARLIPRWIELTSELRQKTGAWESDMAAFVVASAEIGLSYKLQNIAAWMNWPEEAVKGAPIIHYCQEVEDHDGNRLWGKRSYRPWQPIDINPQQAKLDYCRDLLAILKRYVALRRVEAQGRIDETGWQEIRVYLRDREPLFMRSQTTNPALAKLSNFMQEEGADDELLYFEIDHDQRVEFKRSDLIAIESEPATAETVAKNGDDALVEIKIVVAGMPPILLLSEVDNPAVEALQHAIAATKGESPDEMMFIQTDESNRVYFLRSSLQTVEIQSIAD